MSFWNLNDGTKVETTTEFEISGGDLEPIPNNTGCVAAIEEAKWDAYEDDEYISLKWRVMQPDQFAKRVIYQKLKVNGTSRDKDPKATADKAKRMLAAIDANAGGKLMKVQGEPEDVDLMSALVGKLMAIRVMVWKMKIEGEEKSGNWVSAVSPAKSAPAQKKPVENDEPLDVPF
jgi:hypothetical protein